jgi:DHA1 family multidrug resistance protein B-like MFS transporter
LSVILGAALGAWLFRDHFFDLLLILVGCVVITFILIQFFIGESLNLAELEAKERENIVQVYLTVAKDRTYMIFLIANILASSIIMQFDNFMPVHLANDFQTFNFAGIEIYGQRMFTLFLIVACFLVVVFMTPINHLFRAISHKRAYLIGVASMTAGMVLSFLNNSFWPIFLSAFIYTFGEIVYTPVVQTIGAKMMDPDKIGAYNGAAAIRQPVSSILASLLVSLSPLVHAKGVSLILALTALVSIMFLFEAVKRHSSSDRKKVI